MLYLHVLAFSFVLIGSVGGWKEVFTVKQYEEFENVYRQKMAGSIFEDRYKGSVHVL